MGWRCMLAVLFLTIILGVTEGLVPATQQKPDAVAAARELIQKARYNDAINKLEQVLEVTPSHTEALSLMGTAVLYAERDFLKAKKRFEEAFRAGGGAVFWVSHSHEVLSAEELADYCRGWLYLRKGEVEFAPEDPQHAFRLPYSQVREFKQNRLAPSRFHLKDASKNFNFGPRTGDESEVLLIIALYKKFSQ